MTTASMLIRRARSHGTTPQQRAVLTAIRELTEARGYPPSIRGIAGHLGVNVNDVYQKLVRLERDGLVARDRNVCRSVRVVEVTV